MDPVVGGTRGGSLPDELVELASLEDGKPITEFLRIGVVDVTGFAGHVLRVGDTAYGLVQGRRTVAAADDDRTVEVFAQGFEDADAKLLQVADYVERWRVINLTR